VSSFNDSHSNNSNNIVDKLSAASHTDTTSSTHNNNEFSDSIQTKGNESLVDIIKTQGHRSPNTLLGNENIIRLEYYRTKNKDILLDKLNSRIVHDE